MTRIVRAFLPLVCAVATIACGGSLHLFDAVDHAAKTLEAAMNQKPDLPRYRELYTAFAGELDKATPAAHSSRERDALTQYERARAGLRDILFIWEEQTSRKAELLPIDNALFGRVQKEYDIPVNTNEPPSIYGSEAIRMIWESTKQRLDAIHIE
ncbi:MAG: hypothetical protein LBQ09_11930 [Acidobacteriaceae bacterium]|jgi:hypothetical protein|nr:hypothetical protein [Acidobacteriaceae bacterium]